MKQLFLMGVFLSIIFTVKAKGFFHQYSCQVQYLYFNKTFYLNLDEKKELEIGEQKLFAELNSVNEGVEISLKRVIDIIDATYQKKVKKTYNKDEKKLSLSLEHPFGGKNDQFLMSCNPREN